MKWLYITGAIIVIVGGTYLFFDKNTSDNVTVITEANATMPSIQILSGEVSVLNSGGNIVKKLEDGEALEAPIRITLSEDGDAMVVYPDGSSARLSPGSEIKIEEGTYDEETKGVSSRIFIYSGHVWSKVVSLATPESLWKVETPHAVATVRGTAFNAGVDNGETEFVGSEHSVDITPIDPDTGKLLEDKVISLIPNKKLVLEDDINRELTLGVRKLVLDSFDKNDSRHKLWFEQNEKRDEIIETIKRELIEAVQNGGEDKNELLRDFILKKRDEIKETNLMFRPEYIEEIPQTDNEAGDPAGVVIENDVVIKEDVVVKEKPPQEPSLNQGTEEGTGTVSNGEGIPVDTITVEMNAPLPIVEGLTVPYKIIAHAKDGRTQDVTKDVKAQVIGGIGVIKESGTFFAQIAPDKKELGEVFGAITGEWTDFATGRIVLFQSKPFSVKLKIETQTDLRG